MKISEALKAIKSAPNTRLAICNNITELSRKNIIGKEEVFAIKLFVYYQIQKWPNHSGDNGYWIPPSNKGLTSPFDQYLLCDRQDSFWKGQQGKLRRMALNFLIKCAEKQEALNEPNA